MTRASARQGASSTASAAFSADGGGRVPTAQAALGAQVELSNQAGKLREGGPSPGKSRLEGTPGPADPGELHLGHGTEG